MIWIVSILIFCIVLVSYHFYSCYKKLIDREDKILELSLNNGSLKRTIETLNTDKTNLENQNKTCRSEHAQVITKLTSTEEELLLVTNKLNKANSELASLKDFKSKIDDAYSVGTYCKPIHDDKVEKQQQVGSTIAQGCGQTPKFFKRQ